MRKNKATRALNFDDKHSDAADVLCRQLVIHVHETVSEFVDAGGGDMENHANMVRGIGANMIVASLALYPVAIRDDLLNNIAVGIKATLEKSVGALGLVGGKIEEAKNAS